MAQANLLISCADRPGIVAAVSGWLFEKGANILDSDQHSTDPYDKGRFFMRVEADFNDILIPDRKMLEKEFAAVAQTWDFSWSLSWGDEKPRVALLASKSGHCLYELLSRWQMHELNCDIVAVVSNHPDHREYVERLGLPYHQVPSHDKPTAEAQIIQLLSGQVDLIVLARYMQILSEDLLAAFSKTPIINIHHSFLPAFIGADPYQQARDRGVKLIGATAHYVTKELDQGPIIEQDVSRVTHRDDVQTMKRVGADLERQVLLRAVRWQLEDRILVDHADGNAQTIVFQ